MGDFHATARRRSEHHRFLALRCDFSRAAYDGLSGAHAWMLEAYADALCKSDQRGPSSSSAADNERALKLYDEAVVILKKMFGDEHEYVTQIESKRTPLIASL